MNKLVSYYNENMRVFAFGIYGERGVFSSIAMSFITKKMIILEDAKM